MNKSVIGMAFILLATGCFGGGPSGQDVLDESDALEGDISSLNESLAELESDMEELDVGDLDIPDELLDDTTGNVSENLSAMDDELAEIESLLAELELEDLNISEDLE